MTLSPYLSAAGSLETIVTFALSNDRRVLADNAASSLVELCANSVNQQADAVRGGDFEPPLPGTTAAEVLGLNADINKGLFFQDGNTSVLRTVRVLGDITTTGLQGRIISG